VDRFPGLRTEVTAETQRTQRGSAFSASLQCKRKSGR
jgi:hypothetical protein